jgi:ribosomal protein S15P/S13E
MEMTTINHEVNEMIQTEEDIYNVIVDLKALLEHYVSGRADNGSTRTQALVTIKEANRLLQKLKE